MNDDDIRVQRTQRALRQAFMDLINEHSYEEISVRAITQRANVGYKTFYRHFQDKEALLYAILGDILQEGQTVFLPPTSPQAAEQNTLAAFRFAHRYADLFRVLLRSPVAETLVQPLIDFGLSEGHRFFGGSDIPDELVAHHFVTSMQYMMRWWLEHGRRFGPDEMAEYANRLLIRPISSLRPA
ncbi:MAG TPA: TetR family transcriptional regulator [Herpetosiphonaceae bacterium]|nr:TetR family transcriptional regulator [Herpetosiphonaceae bacterium]